MLAIAGLRFWLGGAVRWLCSAVRCWRRDLKSALLLCLLAFRAAVRCMAVRRRRAAQGLIAGPITKSTIILAFGGAFDSAAVHIAGRWGCSPNAPRWLCTCECRRGLGCGACRTKHGRQSTAALPSWAQQCWAQSPARRAVGAVR